MGLQPMFLLKSQKNDVFMCIASSGLQQSAFIWKEVAGEYDDEVAVSRLEHKESGYYFIFEIHEGKHFSTFSPGQSVPRKQEYPGAWNLQLSYVNHWLKLLKREVEAPDLWAELAKESQFAEFSGKTENTPFTKEERTAINARLKELSGEIKKSYELSDSQFEFIKSQLKQLASSSERLGRKDWLMYGAGVLFTIAYDLAKSSPQVRDIISYLARSIFDLVHQLPQLIHRAAS